MVLKYLLWDFKDIFKELWATKPYIVMGIGAAKVANLAPHAMQQLRKHPNSENFMNHAINSSLEESLGTLAQATPVLANRLIKIALDEKIRRYTFVSAIQTGLLYASNWSN